MRRIALILGLLVITNNVQAQPTTDSLETLFSSSRRSAPLAFGMSAVVPGLGQAYNRHWIKAAVGIAGEATVLLLYASWRQQGIDGRDAYQMEAHRYWSPIKYAYWLNDYAQYLNQLPDGRLVTTPPVNISSALLNIDLTQPNTWSDSERLVVRTFFQEIQLLERDSYHGDTGAAFSHVLPFFGEQQYYELVGKYFQFAPGWEDYVAIIRDGRLTWIDENGNFIQSIEPEATGPGGTKPNVSTRFYQYAEDHADANTYLRRASRITTLLIVNHLLAAVDAAIFARLHNRRIQVRFGLLKDIQGRTHVAPYVSFPLNRGMH